MKQIIARIQQMNSMLPMFPGPDNTRFSDQDVNDIIVSMIPGAWRTAMAKMDFEPYQASILDLQTTLEKVELIETCESMSLNNRKRKTDQIDREGAISKSRFSGKKKHHPHKSRNGGGKFCVLCEILGLKSDTHNTDNCYNRAKVKNAFKRSKTPTRAKFDQNELNAIVEKRAKALVTKAMDRNGLVYSSGDESGNSK